ncbi:MAG: GSCFA domain-containing protein [Paludibacteraceae bacterium]|nr:GSCFA domain-containing protein [Paludibacteraceae bacterium]
MDFRTEIKVQKADFGISYADRLFFVGSCFSTNMAERLSALKFPLSVNPTGVLYNPASVCQMLQRLLDGELLTAEDTFETDGVWNSFLLHSSFASLSQNELLEKANAALQNAAVALKGANCVFLTFGTAWVYKLKATGGVVGNCHKVPASQFERVRLSPEDVVAECLPVFQQLIEQQPKVHIVLTVSPIRHWKDGAHGNQLSKATLLLAIDQLCQLFPDNVSYFPSYEILMDDLRDYRFYADDMLHPSAMAVDYIFQKFCETYVSTETSAAMKEIEQVVAAACHRPFNAESFGYKLFCERTKTKIDELKKRFPQLDFTKEENAFNQV